MSCRSLGEMRSLRGHTMPFAAVGAYVEEAGTLARMGGYMAARAMPRVGRR